MKSESIFFAYPSQTQYLDEVIESIAQDCTKDKIIIPWPHLDIIGLRIDKLIRDKISHSQALFADVTFWNFNVYYEIGFAIARGVPVIPTVNETFQNAGKNVSRIGIFDTLGQLRYSSSGDFLKQISSNNVIKVSEHKFKSRDFTHPLFILDCLVKHDYRNWIFQAVNDANLNLRSFDPEETPRMSAERAIADVSASAGIIIPILSHEFSDSVSHNLRAAFIAGLAHGMNKETLIIQMDDAPIPLDYREFVETVRSRTEITSAVADFCKIVLVENQKVSVAPKRKKQSVLSLIDIGQSAAENEEERLSEYFLETAEFTRALRSPNSLIIGRKGCGKSAVYGQIGQRVSNDRRNLLIDLKPASHNLSELRQELVDIVNVGVFDHTITAFWEYIIYSEIVFRIREEILDRWKNSVSAYEQVSRIEKDLGMDNEAVSGDFTSRLEIAVKNLVNITSSKESSRVVEFTNELHKGLLRTARELVSENAKNYTKIVLTFDNIDKGWPANRLDLNDIRLVRLLIEALAKVQRELKKTRVDFEYHMTLRNDVYELLLEETPDRGKYNPISVDWSDAHQLRLMLKERIEYALDQETVADAWDLVFPKIESHTDSFFYILDHSLYRPRFIIDLVERMISLAVNRGLEKVTEDVMRSAIYDQSIYLIGYLGYEVRDVTGFDENLFYSFIGVDEIVTKEEIIDILKKTTSAEDAGEIFKILLWYGFLGIAKDQQNISYIYNYNYDFRRMKAEADRDDMLFVVNKAFIVGLS